MRIFSEDIHSFLEQLARFLNFAGVAIIIGGIAFAALAYFREGARSRDWGSAYGQLRSNLQRGILLGLDLLVGGVIISTITAPLTFESVGLLAGIVAIRMLLSFSLAAEMERWVPGLPVPTLANRPAAIPAAEVART